jgi:sulfur relay (sulfurtransferase) DsrF/TusC family protein
MIDSVIHSLALIVRSPPYQQRASRAELDLALAAAAMDLRLEVYFLGASLLQIIGNKDSKPAMLPAGYRAWAALADLGDASLYADIDWLARFPEPEFRLLMPTTGMNTRQMNAAWRGCDYSMVL